MKTRFLQLATLLLSALLAAGPAIAYDDGLAATYAEMFAPVDGAKAGKQLHLLAPEQFVKDIRSGKPYVMVDIRTPGETQFLTANLPDHLTIPLSELFTAEQLARLPTDRPIVVVCQAGVRASAAALALRHIGFTDTYVLKGGFKGLITYLGPKEAYMPLGPETAAR